MARARFHATHRMTMLWQPEFEWLMALRDRVRVQSRELAMPALLSACVASLRCESKPAITRVHRYVSRSLRSRPPNTARRAVYCRLPEFELLQGLQRKLSALQPPLDHVSTAVVALARDSDSSGAELLRQLDAEAIARF